MQIEFADPKVALELGFLVVNGKQYGELSYTLSVPLNTPHFSCKALSSPSAASMAVAVGEQLSTMIILSLYRS
jgi:hypothetical protein